MYFLDVVWLSLSNPQPVSSVMYPTLSTEPSLCPPQGLRQKTYLSASHLMRLMQTLTFVSLRQDYSVKLDCKTKKQTRSLAAAGSSDIPSTLCHTKNDLSSSSSPPVGLSQVFKATSQIWPGLVRPTPYPYSLFPILKRKDQYAVAWWLNAKLILPAGCVMGTNLDTVKHV